MTVIFVNRFFHPDHSATSQLLSDLVFDLAADGFKITVITSRLRYDNLDDRLAPNETIGDVEIIRLWTSRFGRLNLFGRAFDYVTFYISVVVALFRTLRRGDILIVKTDPPMLSVVAAPIAWFRGARLVNWLQDIFPEVAEAIGVGANPVMKTVYATLRPLRNWSLQIAAQNVTLGSRMAQRIATFQLDPTRISVIPNWADGSLLSPISRTSNALREEWGLRERFVVGYSGNLGRAHEYGTLLKVIEQFDSARRDKRSAFWPTVEWLFIGGGALFDEFRREVEARNLAQVHFKPYQPRERLAESLSAADVHLISLRPELEGLIVPSKFYGVAAVGRPAIFIGDQDGEIGRTLGEYNCGFTVTEGDVTELTNTIRYLASEASLCEQLGKNARRAFDLHFDKKIAVARWKDLLSSLDEPKQTN